MHLTVHLTLNCNLTCLLPIYKKFQVSLGSHFVVLKLLFALRFRIFFTFVSALSIFFYPVSPGTFTFQNRCANF